MTTLTMHIARAIDNKPKDWRDGQAAFNALYDTMPDLADSIRGSELDPFNRDERLKDFFEWLSQQSITRELAWRRPPVERCTGCANGIAALDDLLMEE